MFSSKPGSSTKRRSSTSPRRSRSSATPRASASSTRSRGPSCRVCDLAELLGLTQSAVSHQLRLLRSMRLVEVAPRRPPDLLHARRRPHRPPVRAGAGARPGAQHRAGGEARVTDAPAPSASCTPSRPSRSRAWTAAKRWPCSSAASRHLAGVEDFSADVMGQRLHVKYDAARLSTATIADAVADTGMRAWLEHEEPLAGDAAAERARRAAGLDRRAPRSAPACCWSSRGRRGRCRALLFGASIAAGARRRRPPRLESPCARASLDINVLMLIAVAGAIVLRPVVRGRGGRSSCSRSRRRSKRGRSNARATRSAR